MLKVITEEITGWLKGKQLDGKYRVILTKHNKRDDFDGKYVVGVQEFFPATEDKPYRPAQPERWIGTGGSWFLSTLMKGGTQDELFLDYGQGWAVTGMVNAVEKIIEDYVQVVDYYFQGGDSNRVNKGDGHMDNTEIIKDLKQGDDVLGQLEDEEVNTLLHLDINDPEDWEEMMEYL